MTPGPGIEPGTHWWEASALTTAPSLLLYLNQVIHSRYNLFSVCYGLELIESLPGFGLCLGLHLEENRSHQSLQ